MATVPNTLLVLLEEGGQRPDILVNEAISVLDGHAVHDLVFNTALTTWTDQTAALQELFAAVGRRRQFDLTEYRQARLQVNVLTAGAATSEVRLMWSSDQSVWNYLDGATGPATAISATGLQVSAWVDLSAAAVAGGDVFLRGVGINGDGVIDPILGLICAQFR